MRTVIQRPLKVFHTHAHNPFLRRIETQCKERSIQLPGAFADITRRGINHQFVTVLFHIKHLDWMK